MKRVMMMVLVLGIGSVAQARDNSESKNVTYLGMPSHTQPSAVYQVECLKGQTRCTFNGQPIARQDLVGLIPAGKKGWCRMEFCYGTASMKDGVTGLNPEYFGYALRRHAAAATSAVASAPTGTNVE